MTGQSDKDEAMLDEALAWQTALEGEAPDWESYIAWLEADPRHGEVYNALELVSGAVDERRDELRQLLALQQPARNHWLRWRRPLMGVAGAVAAAIALVLFLPILQTPGPLHDYATGNGKSQSIALADGINVTLAPNSHIRVDDKDASHIELASGEAFFDVRHDPERTLTVTAGQYRISDIGTRFSINLAEDILTLGVATGTVSVSSSGMKPVEVTSGHQLLAKGGSLVLSSTDSTDVGSWRFGRLTYNNAPILMVAADISRYSGTHVFVDPSLEAAHFSGSLVIKNGTQLPEELALVLNAKIAPVEGGLRLSAPSQP